MVVRYASVSIEYMMDAGRGNARCACDRACALAIFFIAEVQACDAAVGSFIVPHTAHLLNDPSAEEIVEDALPEARNVRGLTAEVMMRLHALARVE